jgi:hypothetical protein
MKKDGDIAFLVRKHAAKNNAFKLLSSLDVTVEHTQKQDIEEDVSPLPPPSWPLEGVDPIRKKSIMVIFFKIL